MVEGRYSFSTILALLLKTRGVLEVLDMLTAIKSSHFVTEAFLDKCKQHLFGTPIGTLPLDYLPRTMVRR